MQAESDYAEYNLYKQTIDTVEQMWIMNYTR